jgi:hypothetical protein
LFARLKQQNFQQFKIKKYINLMYFKIISNLYVCYANWTNPYWCFCLKRKSVLHWEKLTNKLQFKVREIRNVIARDVDLSDDVDVRHKKVRRGNHRDRISTCQLWSLLRKGESLTLSKITSSKSIQMIIK